MKVVCPVGHPSGAGRHCPLCGRAYVPADQVAQPSSFAMPQPRHAMDEAYEDLVVPAPRAEDPQVQVEALALLSSLASDFDY